MWRWYWLLIWLPEAALPQSEDSTRSYALPPIAIEADVPLRVKRWYSDTTGWAIPGSHVVQLLAQAEGVYLRDYGGQGSLKILSIRGMGAPLTAVTFQGLPLRFPTLGLVNLAPFYLAGLREVILSPGGHLEVSPGAIGLLALRWRPERSEFRIGWQAGSFGEIAADFRRESPSFFLQGMALSTENRYPFSEPEPGLRENAAYRYLQGAWAYRKKRFQCTGWGYSSTQDIPPPVSVGAATGPAEALYQAHVIHTAEWALGHGAELRLQHAMEEIRHKDWIGIEGTSALHSFQALLKGQKGVGGMLKESPSRAVWELGYALYGAIDHVRSNRMAVGFRFFPRFIQVEGAGFLSLQRVREWGYLRAELRMSSLSRFPLQVSGLVRVGWRSFGVEGLRGVRFPSIWERYWVGYGNAALLPEQSWQAQLFGEKQVQRWGFYGALFFAQTRNRIVTIPLSPVRWQAYSLGYVLSRGLEGRVVYEVARWRFWVSATYLEAREYSFTRGGLLPYSPPYTAAWGLRLRAPRWTLSYQGQYVSWRFSSLAATSYSLLPSYVLHGLLIRYTTPSYAVEIGGENLLGAPYQVIQGYPMPGRRLYLRWEGRLATHK
ncbi:MAG: hypothetical protein N2170_07695 [Bacteroidia bacterium]|nr:hypothetical protein [Bacteroidia bacterium]